MSHVDFKIIAYVMSFIISLLTIENGLSNLGVKGPYIGALDP